MWIAKRLHYFLIDLHIVWLSWQGSNLGRHMYQAWAAASPSVDALFLLFQTFLQVIGVVGVAVAVIPWIALPLVPLGIIFIVLRRYFLQTSRDVKRLESTSESGPLSKLASVYATITELWPSSHQFLPKEQSYWVRGLLGRKYTSDQKWCIWKRVYLPDTLKTWRRSLVVECFAKISPVVFRLAPDYHLYLVLCQTLWSPPHSPFLNHHWLLLKRETEVTFYAKSKLTVHGFVWLFFLTSKFGSDREKHFILTSEFRSY